MDFLIVIIASILLCSGIIWFMNRSYTIKPTPNDVIKYEPRDNYDTLSRYVDSAKKDYDKLTTLQQQIGVHTQNAKTVNNVIGFIEDITIDSINVIVRNSSSSIYKNLLCKLNYKKDGVIWNEKFYDDIMKVEKGQSVEFSGLLTSWNENQISIEVIAINREIIRLGGNAGYHYNFILYIYLSKIQVIN